MAMTPYFLPRNAIQAENVANFPTASAFPLEVRGETYRIETKVMGLSSGENRMIVA